MLRAALIGCGRIGSSMADDPLLAGDVFTHAEAYVRSPATELVAVCDADIDLARICAERWGVEHAYTNVATMLAEAAPDVVSVCTPDETHFAVASEVLRSGASVRALLCEKPLATSLEAARSLVRDADATGKILAVAYMRRYAVNLTAVRDFLAGGALGAVTGVTGWYTKGVLHNGSHWFDLLRMLVGEVAWVAARNSLGETGADPTLDVELGLQSGALATLRAARAKDFTLFEMDILAERGRVSITDSGHVVSVYRAAASPRYSGYVELIAEPHDFGNRKDQMLHAVDDLADAMARRRAPACSGADGLAALAIGSAALRAAAGNHRIELTEDQFSGNFS